MDKTEQMITFIGLVTAPVKTLLLCIDDCRLSLLEILPLIGQLQLL
jgi:hypothetical protein